MTTPARRAAADSLRMRFLIERFIDVPDDVDNIIDVPPDVLLSRDPKEEYAARAANAPLRKFQADSARVFLPGPLRGAYSVQQMTLRALPPAEFQQLRRDVRTWLYRFIRMPHVGQQVPITGALTMWLVTRPGAPERVGAPLMEGAAADLLWFYVGHLLSRVGLKQIGICQAPQPKSDHEACGRLFVRRGDAKEYCSERCRARVATRRARGAL